VWFFALGLAPHRQLLLLRGVWEGEFEALSWTCDPHGLQHGFVFEPAGDQGRRILLAPNIGPALEEKVFPAADVFFNQECRVGTPTWLPAQARPFAMGEENAWSAHVAAGEAVLSCYDHSGNLQHTIEVTAALLEKASRSSTPRLCLAPFGSGAAVALGDRLVVTNADGSIDSLNLPGQALRLCPTLRHTRTKAAASPQAEPPGCSST